MHLGWKLDLNYYRIFYHVTTSPLNVLCSSQQVLLMVFEAKVLIKWVKELNAFCFTFISNHLQREDSSFIGLRRVCTTAKRSSIRNRDV